MKTYTVELYINLPEGCDENDIDLILYQATKHSNLRFGVGAILDIEDAEE